MLVTNHVPLPREAKLALVTHRAPLDQMAAVGDTPGDPSPGDVAVARVVRLGKHTVLEGRDSRRVALFPGDVVVGAFGNRYATDQFEGYVGPRSTQVHMLSIGGVLGRVASQNELMIHEPTLLEVLGFVVTPAGRRLSLGAFGLPALPPPPARPRTVLVVGASMNSGKTTAVANTVRGLALAGYRVAAAKLTGTASSKDTWLMHDAGAAGVLDFTDCGHPSTYLLSLDELKALHRTLVAHLARLAPEFVVIEIADGLFQRETRMLLADPEFRAGIDDVVFAGVDSLSIESGVRNLGAWGYRVAATSGLVSCSALGIQESEAAAPGIPCLGAASLAGGALLARLGVAARVPVAGGPVGYLSVGRGGAADSVRLGLVTAGRDAQPGAAH